MRARALLITTHPWDPGKVFNCWLFNRCQRLKRICYLATLRRSMLKLQGPFDGLCHWITQRALPWCVTWLMQLLPPAIHPAHLTGATLSRQQLLVLFHMKLRRCSVNTSEERHVKIWNQLICCLSSPGASNETIQPWDIKPKISKEEPS